nr:unnamed protein product [Spirometra erinaceieuropaei]
MDDKRLPKRLFYGDVATGSRRQGGQIRLYKDSLKSSLKRLQINHIDWEELALDRPTWRRTVKTGAVIYEANRIAAAKAKCEARKSQLRPVRNATAQPLPTCPRCQWIFRARIGLVGHLRINCASRTAPTIVPPPTSSSSSPPPSNSDNSSDPPLPSSSFSSYSSFSSSDSSDEDQDSACPHCERTFTSHIGLVGHLRIHRTETGETVPGVPTYTHRTRLPAHTALAPSRIARVYSTTCAFTRAEMTTVTTHPPHPTHPPGPAPPSLHRHTRPSPPPPPPLPLELTPTTSTSQAHTAHARSPHASAWSVTCESFAQRLANQCLEHQPTPTTLVSTAHTVLALSGIAWAYSDTCASTMTCGRQPPVTPHIHTLSTFLHHHHHTSTRTQLQPPTQVGSPHLDSIPMRLRLHG